jgi:hypothetical protein
MWTHYCTEEESEMEVGKDEPCSWCGKKEDGSDDISEQVQQPGSPGSGIDEQE